MIIRPYTITDYQEVVELLIRSEVEPPVEPSDLSGPGIVAIAKEGIVGFIWALVGQSTQAHIDYLVADKKYPLIGWTLVKVMDKILKDLGIRRYTFYVEPDNDKMIKAVSHETFEVQKLRGLKFFRRELL